MAEFAGVATSLDLFATLRRGMGGIVEAAEGSTEA